MHKLAMTLAILFASTAMAATPKSVTLAIPSNTASAVTSVAIGDAYNYSRDIDGIKVTLTGKTETNVVIVTTIGQPFSGLTNTMATYSLNADTNVFAFTRNTVAEGILEPFNTDAVSISCACVWATNLTLSTTLTNPVSLSITIKTK